MLIPVPDDRVGKVVADAADGKRAIPSSELVESLSSQLAANSGHLARRMIEGLLKAAAKDEAALQAEIEDIIQAFIAKVGIDGNDGPARVIASRFGLIYAAGRLGRRYGALPKKLDTDGAVEKCYALYLGADTKLPFKSRLRQLMIHARALNLGAGKLPKVSKKDRKNTLIYIRSKKSEFEVGIPLGKIHKVFNDWNHIKDSADVKIMRKIEKSKNKNGTDRTHKKPKFTPGKDQRSERMYVFVLPKEGDE
jgi:hypothetical protein